MDLLEVEIKAYCDDFDALKKRLTECGAKDCGVRQDRDQYFNHPKRDFKETDEAFRIRSIEDSHYLTYKGPKLSKKTKTRYEAETGVEDPDTMRSILLKLGFTESLFVKKRRHVYKLKDVEITLDDVEDLGSFVELEIISSDQESAESKLFETAKEIGLNRFESRSYLELIFEKISK